MQLGNITFDAADPPRLAAFWSQAVGQPVTQSEPYFAMLSLENNVRLLFIQVPEGKTVKNRMHLDFHVPDREAEVARLVALGAARRDTHSEFGLTWTTLQDPEGNEFCVAQE